MKKLILLAAVLLMILVACQKEEISPVESPDIATVVDEQSSSDPDQIDPSSLEDSVYMNLKISSSSIMNAYNVSQIPSQFFKVNPIYKTSYYHYKQPDNVSCSWTTYVNCINCIVTANNNYCYPTSINTVRYRCQNYYPQVNTNGASHILALEWYVKTYDYNKVNYSRKSPTNRWEATKRMLAHINSYHSPFVVRSSMGSTGHYRMVFSIDWKQSESASRVYYTDCWYPNTGSFNSNIRSMSLYSFLNSMKLGANCYNMLFMWPK